MPAMLPHIDATFDPLPVPATRVHLTTMHQRTPIIEALRSYAASESVAFATPGHKQGAGLDAQVRVLLDSRFAGSVTSPLMPILASLAACCQQMALRGPELMERTSYLLEWARAALRERSGPALQGLCALLWYHPPSSPEVHQEPSQDAQHEAAWRLSA